MTFQKLVLATSVCAALSGVSGVVRADILGVPGEALLVTPVVHEPLATSSVETYVALRVPKTIGSDTVINYYTAPNTTVEGTVTVQTLNDPLIYWALFNENSEKIVDGTCQVSPGDATIWTTDTALRTLQVAQANGMVNNLPPGLPNPVCGPNNPPNRFGYVIFQTISGADGEVADFAFTADAMVRLDGFASDVGVPVVPMADAADPLPSGSGFPVYMNEVIAGGAYSNGVPSSPVRYAPIVAGIRFGIFNDLDDRVTQMPITGPNPAANGLGIAAHVYWFNMNLATRVAAIDLYDDMEGQCSHRLAVPRELNIWAYNTQGARATAVPGNWALTGTLASWVPNSVTNLIDWVNGVPTVSQYYCSPDYFDPRLAVAPPYFGSLTGYAENWIPGYAYPGQPADGNEHTAGLQYALIQSRGTPFWTGHLATDIGTE